MGMKKTTAARPVILGTALLLASAAWAAASAPRVAVLPFIPRDGTHPREGWAVCVKLIGGLDPRLQVRAVDWRELSRVMEEHGLDKKGLGRPEELRKVGRALGVDRVMTGSFITQAGHSLARPLMISVRTGRWMRASERRVERDLVVAAPVFPIEPPVLDDEDSLAMRDSPSDYSRCEGAGARVDELERSILELKARYWALQLRRGVLYKTMKFNPGSTISDPALKGELYARMKAWTRQPLIPELTPHEIQQFADADAKAVELARACGIL